MHYKKGSRNSTVSRLTAACVLFFFCSSIFGQSAEPLIMNEYRLLDRYLERADTASERAEWQRMAVFGIETVKSGWETGPAGLFNGMTIKDAEEMMHSYAEERYIQWLADSFFSGLPSPDTSALIESIRNANDKYLFTYDDNGKLIRDSGGTPVLRKTEGLSEDSRCWENDVLQGRASALDAFLCSTEGLEAEFEDFIDSGSSNMGGELFSARFNRYRGRFLAELDSLCRYEQKRFVSSRSNDQYSLRKKTEGQSASVIVSERITEAEERLDKALSGLINGLEAVVPSPEPDGQVIDPDRWHEDFRKVFDSGIRIWNDAEEKLLADRLEWEQQAAVNISDGEKIWAESFGLIRSEREKWQRKLGSIISRGREEWAERESGFAAVLEKAEAELNETIRTKTLTVERQIDGITDIIIKSSGVIRSAEKSLEYWNGKSAADGKAIEAVSFWTNAKALHENYLSQAMLKLSGLCGTILRDETENPSGDCSATAQDLYFLDGMLGSGYNGTARNIYPDEYQIRLFKAELLKKYWDRQASIAQSVYEYANDASSNRARESETMEKLNTASEMLENAKSRFDSAMEALKNAGAAMHGAREVIDEKQAVLEARQAEMEEAGIRYREALDLLKTAEPDAYRKQIAELHKQLIYPEADGGSGEYTAYILALHAYDRAKGYAALARMLEQLETGKAASTGADGKSVAELKAARDSAASWRYGTGLPDLKGLGLDAGDYLADQILSEYERAGAAGDAAETAYIRLRADGWAEYARNMREAEHQARIQEIGLLSGEDFAEWMRQSLGIEAYADDGTAMAAALFARDDELYRDLEDFQGNCTELAGYLAETAKKRKLYMNAASACEAVEIMEQINGIIRSGFLVFAEPVDNQDNAAVWRSFINGYDWDGLRRSFADSYGRIGEASWAVVYDRICARKLTCENIAEFCLAWKNALEGVMSCFTDPDAIRGLYRQNKLAADFISGTSGLFVIGLPDSLLPEKSGDGHTEAAPDSKLDLGEYIFGQHNSDYRKALNCGVLLERYRHIHPALLIEERAAAKKDAGILFEEYGIIEINEGNWCLQGADSLYKYFLSMPERTDPLSWLAGFSAEAEAAVSGLPPALAGAVEDFIRQNINYALVSALKDGSYDVNEPAADETAVLSDQQDTAHVFFSRLAAYASGKPLEGHEQIVILADLYNALSGKSGDFLKGPGNSVAMLLEEAAAAEIAVSVLNDPGFNRNDFLADPECIMEVVSDYALELGLEGSPVFPGLYKAAADTLSRALLLSNEPDAEHPGTGTLTSDETEEMLRAERWKDGLTHSEALGKAGTAEILYSLKKLVDENKGLESGQSYSSEDLEQYLTTRFAGGDPRLYEIISGCCEFKDGLLFSMDNHVPYSSIPVPAGLSGLLPEDLLFAVFGAVSLENEIIGWLNENDVNGSPKTSGVIRETLPEFADWLVAEKFPDNPATERIAELVGNAVAELIAGCQDDEYPGADKMSGFGEILCGSAADAFSIYTRTLSRDAAPGAEGLTAAACLMEADLYSEEKPDSINIMEERQNTLLYRLAEILDGINLASGISSAAYRKIREMHNDGDLRREGFLEALASDADPGNIGSDGIRNYVLQLMLLQHALSLSGNGDDSVPEPEPDYILEDFCKERLGFYSVREFMLAGYQFETFLLGRSAEDSAALEGFIAAGLASLGDERWRSITDDKEIECLYGFQLNRKDYIRALDGSEEVYLSGRYGKDDFYLKNRALMNLKSGYSGYSPERFSGGLDYLLKNRQARINCFSGSLSFILESQDDILRRISNELNLKKAAAELYKSGNILKQRFDRKQFNFRAYLEDCLPAADDSDRFYNNEILEISGLYADAEQRLGTALDVVADSTPDESGFGIPEILYEELADAGGEWNNVLKKNESIKKIIAETGFTMDYITRTTAAERMNDLVLKEGAFNKAGTENARALSGWQECLDEFYRLQTAYNEAFSIMTSAENNYEAARTEYERAEAVHQYASTSYLGAESAGMPGERTASAADPEAKLLNALRKQRTSTAVYETLTDLQNGEIQREDFIVRDEEYRNSFETYRNDSIRNICWEKIADALGRKIIEQKRNLAVLNEEIERNMENSLIRSVKYSLGTEVFHELSNKPGMPEGSLSWADYYRVTIKNGGLFLGLQTEPTGRLEYDGGGKYSYRRIITGTGGNVFVNEDERNKYFYFGGTVEELCSVWGFEHNEAEAAQKGYQLFSGNTGQPEASSFTDVRKEWAAGFLETLNRSGDAAGMLKEWAMALWYSDFQDSGLRKRDDLNGTGVLENSLWNEVYSETEPDGFLGPVLPKVRDAMIEYSRDSYRLKLEEEGRRCTEKWLNDQSFRFFRQAAHLGALSGKNIENDHFLASYPRVRLYEHTIESAEDCRRIHLERSGKLCSGCGEFLYDGDMHDGYSGSRTGDSSSDVCDIRRADGELAGRAGEGPGYGEADC